VPSLPIVNPPQDGGAWPKACPAGRVTVEKVYKEVLAQVAIAGDELDGTDG